MKKLIVPAFLLCFFFTFLIPQVQNAYDRVTPQVLFLSIINFLGVLYIFYNTSFKTIVDIIKPNKLFICYLLYIIISGISIIIADNQVEAIVIYSKYLTYLTTFSLIILFVKLYNFNIVDFFFKIIIVSIFIESAAVLYLVIDDVIINGNEFLRSNDYKGFAANINITSFSLVIQSPVIFYYLFKEGGKAKLSFLYFMIFMTSLSLFFLLSRGAFIAFTLITGIVFIYKLIKEQKIVIAKIGISIIVLLISFQVANNIIDSKDSNVIVDRVSSLKLDNSDESINQRLRFYSAAINSITKNPLLGIGLGNWKFVSIKYDQKEMTEYIVPYYAHNDFLQIGAEIGIIGMLVYIYFLFNPFIMLFKKIYSNKESFIDVILFVMLVVYLIDSTLNFPLNRPISHVFLFFLIVVFQENQNKLKGKKID